MRFHPQYCDMPCRGGYHIHVSIQYNVRPAVGSVTVWLQQEEIHKTVKKLSLSLLDSSSCALSIFLNISRTPRLSEENKLLNV